MITSPDLTQPVAEQPAVNLFSSMGLLWFYVLLVNKQQGFKEVSLALADSLSGNGEISAILSEADPNPVFSPVQIFWNPEGREIRRNWFPLWERALKLGICLQQAAIHRDPQWSYSSFSDELAKIRTEAKNALFSPITVIQKETIDDDCCIDDKAVYKTLSKIIDKWRERQTTETIPAPDQENNELTETIILAPAQDNLPPTMLQREEEFTETVILSSRTANAGSDETPRPGATDGFVCETVIMSPGMQPESTVAATMATADKLTETIILTPRKTRGKGWKNTNE
jgi:hypothetical protein